MEPRRREYRQESQCQRRTGNRTKKRARIISGAQDEGMGSPVSIRAFSDGYQGASIEHPLMDPQRGRRGTKCTTVCAAGNSHACFTRVIEISSRIIVGVPAKKPMSASTKRISEKRISGAEWGHWRPSEHSLIIESDGYQGNYIENSLMDPQRGICAETHMLALHD